MLKRLEPNPEGVWVMVHSRQGQLSTIPSRLLLALAVACSATSVHCCMGERGRILWVAFAGDGF